MSLFKTRFTRQHLPRPEVFSTALSVLAILVILLSVTAVTAEIVTNWHRGTVRFLLVALLLTGGVSGAALLLGLSVLLRYLFSMAISSKMIERGQREGQQLSQTLSDFEAREDVTATGAEGHEAGTRRSVITVMPSAGSVNQAEIAELLTEITENTLLSESERQEKLVFFRQRRFEAMRTKVEQIIEKAQWHEAERMLEELNRRYPKSTEADKLKKQLAEAIRDFEAAEIQNAGEQIRSYTSLGLWDRALEVAHEVADQHPDNRDAQQLVKSVDMEHEAIMKEDCRRLYREIEHLVARRHWREAHATAENLLERYPDSPESTKLKDQLEELSRNAQVQERRESEQQITEHLREGRYRQAYEIAHDLIDKYPTSPQAEALRARMEWLRGRAGVG